MNTPLRGGTDQFNTRGGRGNGGEGKSERVVKKFNFRKHRS